jgi:2-succinyl-6-hydroxy-2,4-cyclohexadiene-1-carboxylate synthase
MGERQRLVFLHGFTQTHHHWHRCAAMIAERLDPEPVLALIDMPGHGLSSSERLTIEQAAPLLPHLAGRGTYIGYSMGGRFALAAACLQPPQIERLVVIGANAGLDDPGDRAARRAEDDERANRIEQIGVDAFIDEWLSMPIFTGLGVDAADRSHRRRNTAAGLASSLRLAGTGAQQPIWPSLASLSIPVLVLAGEGDAKFRAIGERIAAAVPDGQFDVIQGAGHAAHSEQPEATAALIAGWLSG